MMEAWLLLITVCIILFVFIIPKHKVGPFQYLANPSTNSNSSNNSYSSNNSGSSYTQNTSGDPRKTSANAGSITLGTGNASYSIQPYEEYITIQNYGQNSIDITGWVLKNSKGDQVYRVGSSEQVFTADTVVIPQAARILGDGMEDVVLRPNETAIISTGAISNTYPYKITSFKENICTGYLGTSQYYTFSPYVGSNCVNPSSEAGIRNLDRECQDFVNSLSSCRTPEYQTVDSKGQICNGCVNGKAGLSNSCVAFIKSHFSYDSCVANHRYDANFEGNQWRIFLGQKWELWAKDHETIYLYDRQGNLVDYKKY
ncbi:MAG: seg [Parcubacteria group bacterium]|nr:seg [Parcubacteria group bacterium]